MARKKKKAEGKHEASRKWGMQHVLHEMETKNKLVNTAHRTGYQVATVVVGGALATALMGKHGLWGGLIAAVAGNFWKIPALTEVGLGAMAASVFIPWEDTSTVKDRFTTLYKKSGIDKLVDMVSNKSQSNQRSSGPGERSEESTEQPDTTAVGSVPESLETLNHIEQQLVSSAMDFHSRNASKMSGVNLPKNSDQDLSLM